MSLRIEEHEYQYQHKAAFTLDFKMGSPWSDQADRGLFHKTSLPNKPGLFQLVYAQLDLFLTKSYENKSD